jgi:hypothetical protein
MARSSSPDDPPERPNLRSTVGLIGAWTVGACCAVAGALVVTLAGIGLFDLVRLVWP